MGRHNTGAGAMVAGAMAPWVNLHQKEPLSFPEWHEDGNCHQPPTGMDRQEWADQWFAPDGTAEALAAKTQCMSCPVRARCLNEARDRAEEWGIWGGVQFEALDEVGKCAAGHEQTSENVRLKFVKGKSYPICRLCDNAARVERKRAA